MGEGTVIVVLENVNEAPVFTAFAEATPLTNPATVYIPKVLATGFALRADEDEENAQTTPSRRRTTTLVLMLDTITYTVRGL